MIKVADIEKESIVDGVGIRYTIFTQGCSHNCEGCHNPSTHDFNGGTPMSDVKLLADIKSDPLIDGITLSGGDPFFQAAELINLVKQCKRFGLTVWAYTGFIFEEFIKFMDNEKCDKRITQDMIDLLKLIDVLVDGPFILSMKTYECLYRGSYNQRIIDVPNSIKEHRVVELTKF